MPLAVARQPRRRGAAAATGARSHRDRAVKPKLVTRAENRGNDRISYPQGHAGSRVVLRQVKAIEENWPGKLIPELFFVFATTYRYA